MGRRWSSAPQGACSGHNRRVIAHRDDVESGGAEAGHIAGFYFRGLGLIARLEDLDYDDGESR